MSNRGRGHHRGGMNGDAKGRGNGISAARASSPVDQGELGQLRFRYSEQLGILKDMFPDWTDEDMVYALQDANGNLESTVEHMTQGQSSSRSIVGFCVVDGTSLTSSIYRSRGTLGRGEEEGSVALQGQRRNDVVVQRYSESPNESWWSWRSRRRGSGGKST